MLLLNGGEHSSHCTTPIPAVCGPQPSRGASLRTALARHSHRCAACPEVLCSQQWTTPHMAGSARGPAPASLPAQWLSAYPSRQLCISVPSMPAPAGSHTLLFGCALWVFNCTGVPVALREREPEGPLFSESGDSYQRLVEEQVGAPPALTCLLLAEAWQACSSACAAWHATGSGSFACKQRDSATRVGAGRAPGDQHYDSFSPVCALHPQLPDSWLPPLDLPGQPQGSMHRSVSQVGQQDCQKCDSLGHLDGPICNCGHPASHLVIRCCWVTSACCSSGLACVVADKTLSLLFLPSLVQHSPLQARAAPPAGLRAVPRDGGSGTHGMQSVLSTPTSAAPSGQGGTLRNKRLELPPSQLTRKMAPWPLHDAHLQSPMPLPHPASARLSSPSCSGQCQPWHLCY